MTEPVPASPAVEKRKVTMLSVSAMPDGAIARHEAVDYVPTDILDAYVTDAQGRWQSVTVGDEHDPGPGGDDGDTHYPPHLTGGSA